MKDLTLLAEGRTAQVFAWEKDTVLKLYFDWFPERFVNIEYERNLIIREYDDVPSPKLIERVEIAGKTGLVFERIDGETLLWHLQNNGLQYQQYARMMSELQYKIHTIDIPKLPAVEVSIKMSLNNTDQITNKKKGLILESLDSLEKDSKLCHFDFHPDQVMLTSKGPQIIDWMCAAGASPSADVARTYLLSFGHRYSQSKEPIDQILNFNIDPFLNSYLQSYLQLNPGVTKESIYSWFLPLAAERLVVGPESEHPIMLRVIDYLLQ